MTARYAKPHGDGWTKDGTVPGAEKENMLFRHRLKRCTVISAVAPLKADSIEHCLAGDHYHLSIASWRGWDSSPRNVCPPTDELCMWVLDQFGIPPDAPIVTLSPAVVAKRLKEEGIPTNNCRHYYIPMGGKTT